MGTAEIQDEIDGVQEELDRTRQEIDELEAAHAEVLNEIEALEAELRDALEEAMLTESLIASMITESQGNALSPGIPVWASSGASAIERAYWLASEHASTEMARLREGISEVDQRPRLQAPSFGRPVPTALHRTRVAEAVTRTAADLTRRPSVSRTADPSPRLLRISKGDVHLATLPIVRYAGPEGKDLYGWAWAGETGAVPYLLQSITLPPDLHEACSTIAVSGQVRVALAERIGVEVTAAVLSREGRRVIIAVGGPGRPDLLSLDADGKLWITETKGTLGATQLSKAGIEARIKNPSDPDGDSTIQRWENSPEFLQRRGNDLLQALRSLISSAADDATRRDLTALMARFREACESQFLGENYGVEVFQVGSEFWGLQPLTISPVLDRYCYNVRHSRLVQIDIEEASR